MNKIKPNESVLKPLENKNREKADVIFNKLYPKWKGKKTWDVIRSQTYPIKETKSGPDTNDIL